MYPLSPSLRLKYYTMIGKRRGIGRGEKEEGGREGREGCFLFPTPFLRFFFIKNCQVPLYKSDFFYMMQCIVLVLSKGSRKKSSSANVQAIKRGGGGGGGPGH